MLSMPPVTNRPPSPARIACAASMTDFNPEPHTLLTVVAPTLSGKPPKIAAWRAGFCPRPAETTLPMITSSICAISLIPARSAAALTTIAPKRGAGKLLRLPWKRPEGVRAALRMTGSRLF